ncbi:MAG: ABC transporter permease [Bacteroidales bacterium]|nr:ABC transporter permease [Bacteroidales bacterium]
MIRHALKNLWSRRWTNAWLTLELVVLTILAWVILDPVIVSLYDASRPMGYPNEKLAYFSFKPFDKEWRFYNPELDDSVHFFQAVRQIQAQLQERPEIENVALTYTFAQVGTGMCSFNNYFQDADTIYAPSVQYAHGENYFQTLGIEILYPQGMTAEQLDQTPVNWRDYIITESLARYLFGRPDVVGRHLLRPGYEKSNFPPLKVFAVIKDVRINPAVNSTMAVFQPYYICFDYSNNSYGSLYRGQGNFLVRFKPGVNPDDFIDDNRHWINNVLHAGNLYIYEAKSLPRIAEELNVDLEITNQARIGILLTVFFLLNAVLGVVGTLYLQTRRRQREAGVMKSFGASTRRLATTLVIESVILTFITWLAGCLLYLQYAISSGLAESVSQNHVPGVDSWVSHFWGHYALISLIVLALLLLVMIAGTLPAALKISRTRPADALADE